MSAQPYGLRCPRPAPSRRLGLAAALGLTLLVAGCVPSDGDGGDNGGNGPDPCAFALGSESAIHVSETCGSLTGDGSAAAPFANLAQAVAVAKAGDTIALSVGVYAGGVTLPVDVQLTGFEADKTTVRGDGAQVLLVSGGGATAISGLTLEGKAERGLVVEKAALKLSGVRVQGLKGHGVYVTGSPSVEIRSSTIRANGGTGVVVKASGLVGIIDPIHAPVPRDLDAPGALGAGFGPASLIQGNLGGGVAIIDPIHKPKSDGTSAWDLLLKATDVQGNRGFGVALYGASAQVVRSAIRDTVKADNGAWADGLLIAKAAAGDTLSVSVDAQSVLVGNGRAGLLAMAAAKVAIAGEVSRNGGSGAWAKGAGASITAAVTALFYQNAMVGLSVSKNAELIVDGARILGTTEAPVNNSTAKAADGIGIYEGARARVDKAIIEGNARAGVVVHNAGKVAGTGALDVVITGCSIKGNKYGIVINGSDDEADYATQNDTAPASKDGEPGTGQAGGRKDLSSDLEVQTDLCEDGEACAPATID